MTSPLVIDDATQQLLFLDARTANTFTDEAVTDEQVRAIYELTKFGPTSMNQQPLRIVLIRSDDARTRLLGHMMEGNVAKTAKAPLVAVLAADIDFHEEFDRVFPYLENPASFFADETARTNSATFNTAIQIGYFIVGVRAAGLAAGPMSGFNRETMSKEFFPDGRHVALCVVNIGHPGDDAWRDRLPRLDYDEVVQSV